MQGQNNDIVPERKVTNLIFVRSFVLNQKTMMHLSVQGRKQRDQKISTQSFIFVQAVSLSVSVTYCCICKSTLWTKNNFHFLSLLCSEISVLSFEQLKDHFMKFLGKE